MWISTGMRLSLVQVKELMRAASPLRLDNALWMIDGFCVSNAGCVSSVSGLSGKRSALCLIVALCTQAMSSTPATPGLSAFIRCAA